MQIGDLFTGNVDRPEAPRATGGSASGRLCGAIVALFLMEGFIAKSYLFVGNDPVAAHYIVSAGLTVLAMIGVFLARFRGVRPEITYALFALSVIWSALSSYLSGYQPNLLATATYALLIMGNVFLIPMLALAAEIEVRRFVNWACAVAVLFSLALFIFQRNLTYDPLSDRFSGALISVAVACNIFFFATLLAFAAMKEARSPTMIFFWGTISLLSFLFEFMTLTRSALLETIFGVLILSSCSARGQIIRARIVVIGTGLLLAATLILGLTIGGAIKVDDQLQNFRLSDQGFTSSRDSNWGFGIERVSNAPLFGEGMLTKQTQGGTRAIELSTEDNYDQLYDPHSLPLSLAVQAGIPFMLIVMSLIIFILTQFVRAVGWGGAMASPEFVIAAVNLATMVPAGGDLTSLGATVDRIFWMFIGTLALKTIMVRRAQRSVNQPHVGLAPVPVAQFASAG